MKKADEEIAELDKLVESVREVSLVLWCGRPVSLWCGGR